MDGSLWDTNGGGRGASILELDWPKDLEPDWKPSSPCIPCFPKVTGGKEWISPTWTDLKWLITPHPLGGCNMGTEASNGIVDHTGAVFGYPGLYVADGAIVPEAYRDQPLAYHCLPVRADCAPYRH